MKEITPRADADPRRVERLRALAYVLDSSIPVPGTGMRIGLDPIIGLIPGIGDAVGGLMSSYIVLQAARMGAPVTVLLRMLLNVAAEAVVGVIPIVGDLFDAGFKANVRNLALLRESMEDPAATRRSSIFVVGAVAVGLLLILAGFVYGTVVVLDALGTLVRGGTVDA